MLSFVVGERGSFAAPVTPLGTMAGLPPRRHSLTPHTSRAKKATLAQTGGHMWVCLLSVGSPPGKGNDGIGERSLLGIDGKISGEDW